MSRWLAYSLLSILIWGIWGVVPRAASSHLSPLAMQVLSTAGLLPVALLFGLSGGKAPERNLRRGAAYAFATGCCGSVGNLATLVALERGGEASAVFPFTGMYPLVTVILARVLLKEKLRLIQGAGIALALAAIYLFNAEPAVAADPTALPWWRRPVSAWIFYALVALALYGIAGVTQKLSTNNISTRLSTVYFAVAFVPVACLILYTQPLDWNFPGRDWFLSVLFGTLIGFGMLAQFAAYRAGKASVVTAVTALYPALTAVLAVLLFSEHLDLRKLVAIALALAAGAALSSS